MESPCLETFLKWDLYKILLSIIMDILWKIFLNMDYNRLFLWYCFAWIIAIKGSNYTKFIFPAMWKLFILMAESQRDKQIFWSEKCWHYTCNQGILCTWHVKQEQVYLNSSCFEKISCKNQLSSITIVTHITFPCLCETHQAP